MNNYFTFILLYFFCFLVISCDKIVEDKVFIKGSYYDYYVFINDSIDYQDSISISVSLKKVSIPKVTVRSTYTIDSSTFTKSKSSLIDKKRDFRLLPTLLSSRFGEMKSFPRFAHATTDLNNDTLIFERTEQIEGVGKIKITDKYWHIGDSIFDDINIDRRTTLIAGQSESELGTKNALFYCDSVFGIPGAEYYFEKDTIKLKLRSMIILGRE